MDISRIVNISFIFAVLVLPAWIVWRLPRLYISIPIGTLVFWGWSVVCGDLLLNLDPEYDSIAPAMMYLLGWVMNGVFYKLDVLPLEYVNEMPLVLHKGLIETN